MSTAVALPSWCRIVREASADVIAEFAARARISSPDDAAAVLAARLGAEDVEVFVVLLLDAQHRLIAAQKVTRGLVNSSLVHPREVFRLAVAIGASGIVCAHNQTSNVLDPSAEDRTVTRELVAAGKVLGIEIMDHPIVGIDPTTFYSFAATGLL